VPQPQPPPAAAPVVVPVEPALLAAVVLVPPVVPVELVADVPVLELCIPVEPVDELELLCVPVEPVVDVLPLDEALLDVPLEPVPLDDVLPAVVLEAELLLDDVPEVPVEPPLLDDVLLAVVAMVPVVPVEPALVVVVVGLPASGAWQAPSPSQLPPSPHATPASVVGLLHWPVAGSQAPTSMHAAVEVHVTVDVGLPQTPA
jgi:hypothetical protein